MLVFRDATRRISSRAAVKGLHATIGRMVRDPVGDCATEALLRAAELECAAADLALSAEHTLASITDALASHLLGGRSTALDWIGRSLAELRLPDELCLRTPEGYAYYGLDPRRFAAIASSGELGIGSRPAAVIGVRSIGTSLAAILAEAIAQGGVDVERISVRPNGEPWARVLHLRDSERAFVDRMRERGAIFLVADEGPGMSGSTLLAVAEALEQAGVPNDAIVMCCSRLADPTTLLARDAAARWSRYRRCAIAPALCPEGMLDLSAGAWRSVMCGDDARHWPGVWTQLERLKWRSPDGLWLDKYEGLAPYSNAAFERACTLARAGYAPAPSVLGFGFVRYAWLPGRPARVADLGPAALAELARYCAFRTRGCPAPSSDSSELSAMLLANVREATGVDLTGRVELEVRVPVIADARMQPHEWRIDGTKLYKTDGHAHGEGHLYPGPTDICWDLAGAIIEWNMDRPHAEMFLSHYARLSGERPEGRLDGYLLAYCAARMGEMCVAAMSENESEQARLRAAYVHYSQKLSRAMREQGLAPDTSNAA